MAQHGGVEREAMVSRLNRQAAVVSKTRQQVRLQTYQLGSYLLGLRRRLKSIQSLIGLKSPRRNLQEKARRCQYKVVFPSILLAH
jgi:hypothetical protein